MLYEVITDRLAQAGAKAALEDQATVKENCCKIIRTREWFSKELVEVAENIWPSATNSYNFV